MKKRPPSIDLEDDIVHTNRNIGIIWNYGGNGFTISKNLGVPEDIGNKVYENYFKAFPKLKDYFTEVQNDSLKQGYILIDPVTRRKYFFIKHSGLNVNKIKRAALNFPKRMGPIIEI